MAFLDDRVWCHPKWAPLSDAAFRAGISAICYSHGFKTRGALRDADVTTLGVTRDVTDELVAAGLWERHGDGVVIHDWSVYNASDVEKRREQGRLRTQRWREKQASPNGHRDALRDDVTVTQSDAPDSESESELLPLTPQSGDFVTRHDDEGTPRELGLNPRALGTNPRANAVRQLDERRQALRDAVKTEAKLWPRQSTDSVHERIDIIEREHGLRLNDHERSLIVDDVIERWRLA